MVTTSNFSFSNCKAKALLHLSNSLGYVALDSPRSELASASLPNALFSMEEQANIFSLVRYPRKPGSGRLPRPRNFPLTARACFAQTLTTRPLLDASSKPDGAPAGKGHGAPQHLTPTSALGVVCPAVHALQLEQQSQNVSSQEGAEVTAATSEMHHVYDPTERRAHRRLTLGVLRPGTGRQARPRIFTLKFKAPPPKQQAPPPEPQPSPQLATPEPSTSHGQAASPTQQQTGDGFEPYLDDLVTLAFELARRDAARQEAVPDTAMTEAIQVVAAAGTPAAAVQETAAAVQEAATAAVPTPVHCRILGLSPCTGSAQRTPALAHATPIEGVPERFVIPSSAAYMGGRRTNPTALSGRDALDSEAAKSCSSSETGMTPIEGVPERMTKRPRFTLLALKHWSPLAAVNKRQDAHGSSAELGVAPPGAANSCQQEQPVELQARSILAGDGAPGVPNASCGVGAGGDGAVVARLSAAAAGEAGPRCSPAKDGDNDDGFTAAGVADLVTGDEASVTAADIAALNLTAADIAAAATAAARAAMLRLQEFAFHGATDVEPKSATSLLTYASTPEPSSSGSGGTPAVVKMQNLAAAAVNAVQRAAEAMGGPPTCRAPLHWPHARLPPRPPSAAGRAASGATAAAAAGGSNGKATEDAMLRRASYSSDGPPSAGIIIHRAAPDALIFPSRTPSPMGGIRWSAGPQGHLPLPDAGPDDGGPVDRNPTVTPTLEAVASLAGGYAAAAGAAIAGTSMPAGRETRGVDVFRGFHASHGGASTTHCSNGGPAGNSGGQGHADAAAGGSDEPSDSDDGDGGPCPEDMGVDDDDDDGCGCDGPGGQERAIGSVMRHDDDNHEDDDEEGAMEEVMGLPDEPQTAGRPSGRNSGGGSQAAGEQPRSTAAAAAVSSEVALRVMEGHAHERRLAGNRKSLAGDGLTMDDMGTRRSTRSRVRPLQYWRGEAKSYGRSHKSLPTVTTIKMRTPEPQWPLPSGKQEKAKRKARVQQAMADAMEA